MKIFWTKKFILSTIVIAFFYIAITVYLMNVSLVKDTLFSAYSLEYKYNLMTSLFWGMWTSMSRPSLALLFIISFLTGLNVSLIVKRIFILRSFGKINFVVGGSSLLGIISSGCASCGLSVIAFLGLGGAIAYLPFYGIELSFIAILLLLVSFYFLVKDTAKICKKNGGVCLI
ncbi:MAG: hypothetical protein UR46_C0029G0009 [Parcubacteria group bacterium GW2011_GWA1_33_6]|uniref:Uncharacterized protein n=1 Tax=Candidatus Staskawiczbacteria bacterium RIFCSPHIGHO2_02_FULL_33_16 TaxID=1802204 RepID=A0A1G2HYR8_9BACT|nr:MAG: hypothetical protein UR31_C0012G0005 [Parcubacteria group bacterium GW2011_GWA2_33_14]KKP54200.1 MAG: hypothetical protein UR46_C0029G0009 [Parcubacteria group bacterium GW2011_GWA1_33_6]OGZ67341.1 MAG: hypothetical protein A3D34_02800 [Candidatus Staskawiczbacteria bacterium RIFCSPHIGHO2_02_FULL_33_16]OGZ70123.1 MAG: hypothetical protein A2980_03590 [Candidatus Staskawiczbacteria bacterium RIFCSPLOWO2_01_FULL_33_13]